MLISVKNSLLWVLDNSNRIRSKIVSAVRTPVFVDDVDELNDAMMEAKMDAKVQISQFLNETIANECKRKSSKLSRRVISKDSWRVKEHMMLKKQRNSL